MISKGEKVASFLEKAIFFIFVIVFAIIFVLLFGFDFLSYNLKYDFLLPNFVILILICLLAFGLYFVLRKRRAKEDIPNKKYFIILAIIFLVMCSIQFIIVYNIYFLAGWDAGVIRDLTNGYFNKGHLHNTWYLSVYPNNILLLWIITLIKMVPFVGMKYSFLLGVNCLLVSLACLFCSLTVRNITGNNRLALWSYAISGPLILLNPWVSIPYSDTFAILFPILILFIYTKRKRGKADWLFIGLFSAIGFYIKPTVIITLIAIIIMEIIRRIRLVSIGDFKINKNFVLKVILLLVGIGIGFLGNKCAIHCLQFTPCHGTEDFDFTHYLMMGQNDKTSGAYSWDDVNFSLENGSKANLKLAYERFTDRNLLEQVNFFAKKTLLNFNDGSFAWWREGTFMYKGFADRTVISSFLRDVYYEGGAYYSYYKQFAQIAWLFTLVFMAFIAFGYKGKNELTIMMAILGMTIFLTIFEPRTRYFYCYAPVFVLAAILGINKLKTKFIDDKRKTVCDNKVKK